RGGARGPPGARAPPGAGPGPAGTREPTGQGLAPRGPPGPPAGTPAAVPPAITATPGTTPVTSGTYATAPPPVVTGTAPAGSSASSVSGYRLSGADMTGWIGRRVQIVGTMTPSAAGASATNPAVTPSATLPEFRVVSVQPISGDCPPQQQ